MSEELKQIAQAMVAPGKGILAMDESHPTCGKRFKKLGIPETEKMRQAYRDMLVTTTGLSDYISGAILFDETIRQTLLDGTPFPKYLADNGIIPGIKVDAGAKVLSGHEDEKVTEGLDGLRERLAEYYKPEVLMDGSHSIERCYEVTELAQRMTFQQLHTQGVLMEGMVLKPSMVISGADASNRADVETVAQQTVRCLMHTVPAAVPGIAFLSGGQSDTEASSHLSAMHNLGINLPWNLTFSYGRALQQSAMSTWNGDEANVAAAQAVLLERARCNGKAALGEYSAD